MSQLPKSFRRFVLLLGLSLMTVGSSGCFSGTLIRGFGNVIYGSSIFWQTSPPIPVSAYFSEEIENTYWNEERYGKVPILDPVEGEHAPLFCIDPPSHDEIMRTLPDSAAGGVPFLAEVSRNNVRIVIENIVDRLGECRFVPLVGPARIHFCHYKCTVYYDKTIRSDWPVPFSHTDQTKEVVYVDHDHLIRCAGPATP